MISRDELQFRACEASTPNGFSCVACRVGKTRIKAKIAGTLARQGKRVLVAVDRKIVLDQAPAEFEAAGISFSPWRGARPATQNPIVLTTVQGTIRHPKILAGFDVAILDEADLRCGEGSKTLGFFREHIPDVRGVSGTATNFIKGRNLPIIGEGRTWPHLDIEITPRDAIESAQPCRPETLAHPRKFQRTGRVGASGDFDIGCEAKSPAGLKMVSDATREGLDIIARENGIAKPVILVHASSIEHAEMLRDKFDTAGFAAIATYSQTPGRWLQSGPGDVQIIVGVNATGRGFDLPPIMLNVLAMASASVAGIIQRCARGGNRFAGKQFNSIIDLGGNLATVGDPDRPQSEICAALDLNERERVEREARRIAEEAAEIERWKEEARRKEEAKRERAKQDSFLHMPRGDSGFPPTCDLASLRADEALAVPAKVSVWIKVDRNGRDYAVVSYRLPGGVELKEFVHAHSGMATSIAEALGSQILPGNMQGLRRALLAAGQPMKVAVGYRPISGPQRYDPDAPERGWNQRFAVLGPIVDGEFIPWFPRVAVVVNG